MDNAFKEIEMIMSRLQELQKKQILSFDTERLPDLEKQSLERNMEVTRLLETVIEFVRRCENKPDADTKSMLMVLNDHVTILLDQNRGLEAKVKEFREKFKREMGQISKGKKAIGSYRSSASTLNAPKVISVTN